MTTVREGGTPLYTGSTSWVTGVVSEDVHSALNVDDVVHIDADHADGVIRVRHIAANGVDILEATDKGSGTLTMRIDDSGNVVAGTVKYGASQTDVETAIGSLNTEVSTATHTEALPAADTLVKRSKVLGTQINNLFVQRNADLKAGWRMTAANLWDGLSRKVCIAWIFALW